MVLRKQGPFKTQKPCARWRDADCDEVADSAPGDPAMVFMFRMASILPTVRAILPVTPSRRIAAGRSLRMIVFENLNNGFTDHAKTRATSARELNKSTTNVMLFEQRLV